MCVIELAVQVFPESAQLVSLEIGDQDALPGPTRPLKRRIHQFQDGAFAKRVRDGFAPTAFLHKQSLKHIGRAGRPPVATGKRK